MLPARGLLLGRNRTHSLQAVTVGLAGLVTMVLFWNAGQLAEWASEHVPVDVVGATLVALLVIASVHAYVNDGLFVNWAVVTLVVFGGTVGGVDVGSAVLPPIQRASLGFAVALVAGVALGTVGFVLGAGVRRVIAPR